MDAEVAKEEQERILLAGPITTLARQTMQRVVAGGGEAIVVASAAEARCAGGPFSRAVFAFDLPDGSGIILAAEMILEERVRDVGFIHPNEDGAAPMLFDARCTEGADSPR